MGDRVWKLPREQFVAAWNGSDSLDEAAAKVRETVGGQVPRWAVMAREEALRKEGEKLKPLPSAVVVNS